MRILLLLFSLGLLMLPLLFIDPGASHAIGKATPTPTPNEPLDVDAALDEALVLLNGREYKAAIELIDEVLLDDTQQWRAWYFRGIAHARQSNWDEAISDYSGALELRPFDAQIWRLRGDAHRQNRDPRQAQADYEQSLFLNPRSTLTYSSLVRLHERDRESVLRDLYQSIVDAYRVNAHVSGNRAVAILDEAIQRVERRTSLTQLGYAYYVRASIWTDNEHWESALADINAALALQPDMQDYYLSRGFIYARTDGPELAAADLYRRMTLLERESIEAEWRTDEPATIEMDHGVVARLRFEGLAGQTVTISARDYLGAGVDPLLVLLDSEGVPIMGDDDGGGGLDALIANYALATDGVYTALVSHANGGFEGAVRVSLR